MKAVLVLVAIAGMAFLAVIALQAWDHYHFGWEENGQWHRSLKRQRKVVDFIHSHDCSLEAAFPASTTFDADLNIVTKSGWKGYRCSGVASKLYITDYELQP